MTLSGHNTYLKTLGKNSLKFRVSLWLIAPLYVYCMHTSAQPPARSHKKEFVTKPNKIKNKVKLYFKVSICYLNTEVAYKGQQHTQDS